MGFSKLYLPSNQLHFEKDHFNGYQRPQLRSADAPDSRQPGRKWKRGVINWQAFTRLTGAQKRALPTEADQLPV